MTVELRTTSGKLLATIDVVDGKTRIDAPEAMRNQLEHLWVTAPGSPDAWLYASDGAAWVEALPANLRPGGMMYAVAV